jgi:hypothetical protein
MKDNIFIFENIATRIYTMLLKVCEKVKFDIENLKILC